MPSQTSSALQTVLDNTVDGKQVFGTSFAVRQDTFNWQGAAGNLTICQPYFITSTTKLFTTALVLQLQAAGKLHLDDPISAYLDTGITRGLHRYRGKDYAPTLTLTHLLAHTSGLPDYFQGQNAHGQSLENALTTGHDQGWTFEQAIERSKSMPPLFAPGTPGKAHYSDTNFQLLGKIIATLSGQSYAENCRDRIIQPLGMNQTYLYQNPSDTTPKSLYYHSRKLSIPLAMSSFGADGGMVSTTGDMLVFLEAFFRGKLFPASDIDALQTWNRIFFPLRSGIGLHLFKLPWILNPTASVPYFIGHSGLSGALAFYSPQAQIFITGTVNQAARPDLAFKTRIRLTRQILNK